MSKIIDEYSDMHKSIYGRFAKNNYYICDSSIDRIESIVNDYATAKGVLYTIIDDGCNLYEIDAIDSCIDYVVRSLVRMGKDNSLKRKGKKRDDKKTKRGGLSERRKRNWISK